MSASEDSLYSSYREMILEHLFAGAVMRHLWLKDFGRVEMLKPQVDDSGYDLVLEAKGIVRHIQLKASHHGAATQRVGINLALADKPSGCVMWLVFNSTTLDLGPFLWLGGEPGERLPDLLKFRIAKHAKANAQGIKTERPRVRIVPRSEFQQLQSIEEVVNRLFGQVHRIT